MSVESLDPNLIDRSSQILSEYENGEALYKEICDILASNKQPLVLNKYNNGLGVLSQLDTNDNEETLVFFLTDLNKNHNDYEYVNNKEEGREVHRRHFKKIKRSRMK